MGTFPSPSDPLDDLTMIAPDAPRRSDDEIANAIVTVLDWTDAHGGIRASVERGRVTLVGTVGFRYQRQAAERSIRRMAGVRAVDNRVVVATSEAVEDVRNAMKAAIRRRLDQPVDVEVAVEVA